MDKQSEDKEKKSGRDHRELGQLLDLFSFQEIAPGAPFWHPNGMVIFKELEKLARKINEEGEYQEISTPIMVKKEVFEKSGHWEHYRENMFWFENPTDKNETLVVKPMNCPESTYVYNSKIRSYKDLPLRLAEIGRLNRNELSGTLGGLFRVRQITMDDAHIYCRPDQVEEEIGKIIESIEKFYSLFDFKPNYALATKPEKALGKKADWDLAEEALKNALDKSGIKYAVEKGEGAFYGPKIEVHLNDSQGRDWQLGTAQLDLVMLPKQFDVSYIDENGKKQMPWVIHRAIFGSFERLLGILLEHFDGNLPVWLTHGKAEVLTIGDKQNKYGAEVFKKLSESGIRAKLNKDNLTIGKKIREAEIQRIPYLLVIGEKEEKNNTVNVRQREKGNLNEISAEEFIEKLKKSR